MGRKMNHPNGADLEKKYLEDIKARIYPSKELRERLSDLGIARNRHDLVRMLELLPHGAAFNIYRFKEGEACPVYYKLFCGGRSWFEMEGERVPDLVAMLLIHTLTGVYSKK